MKQHQNERWGWIDDEWWKFEEELSDSKQTEEVRGSHRVLFEPTSLPLCIECAFSVCICQQARTILPSMNKGAWSPVVAPGNIRAWQK